MGEMNLDIIPQSEDIKLNDLYSYIGNGGDSPDERNQKYIDKQLEQAIQELQEAKELIKQNSVDSLLRYFQTGIVNGEHLPSLVLKGEKGIHRMLASKLDAIIHRLGFEWEETQLNREGKMVLQYKKGEFTLEFATIDPYERTVDFHFDFEEMEREREIKQHKIKHKIKETMERYKDTKRYLQDNKGLKKIKNKRAIERLENNIKKIGEEITEMEKEVVEIDKQKSLLEDIKGKVPEMELEFRRYGFVFEYFKGEQYEV